MLFLPELSFPLSILFTSSVSAGPHRVCGKVSASILLRDEMGLLAATWLSGYKEPNDSSETKTKLDV